MRHDSYESIDADEHQEIELKHLAGTPERIPLSSTRHRSSSLVRQASVLHPQKSTEGTLQLTYWF